MSCAACAGCSSTQYLSSPCSGGHSTTDDHVCAACPASTVSHCSSGTCVSNSGSVTVTCTGCSSPYTLTSGTCVGPTNGCASNPCGVSQLGITCTEPTSVSGFRTCVCPSGTFVLDTDGTTPTTATSSDAQVFTGCGGGSSQPTTSSQVTTQLSQSTTLKTTVTDTVVTQSGGTIEAATITQVVPGTSTTPSTITIAITTTPGSTVDLTAVKESIAAALGLPVDSLVITLASKKRASQSYIVTIKPSQTTTGSPPASPAMMVTVSVSLLWSLLFLIPFW